ncbi:hypothetical protein E4U44_005402 [Claviceps purpurea]|nr:hypothetical protein E4U44_005402 [Claviceps purpurea]
MAIIVTQGREDNWGGNSRAETKAWSQGHPDDLYGRTEEPDATEADDENDDEYAEQDQDVPQDAWQELANIQPSSTDHDLILLCNRDIDVDLSWARHIGRYAAICNRRDAVNYA